MREYSLSADDITVANAAVTLAIINPPTNTPIAIVRAWWSQSSTTTSAQQRIYIATKASAFGTYTGWSPTRLNRSDPLSQVVSGTAGLAGSSGIDATAEGAGAEVILYPDAVNNLNGHLWVPNPPEFLRFNQAQALACIYKLGAAPVNTAGHAFGLNFAELA